MESMQRFYTGFDPFEIHLIVRLVQLLINHLLYTGFLLLNLLILKHLKKVIALCFFRGPFHNQSPFTLKLSLYFVNVSNVFFFLYIFRLIT